MSFLYETGIKFCISSSNLSVSLIPSISERQKSNDVFVEEKCTSNKSDMWEEGMLCFCLVGSRLAVLVTGRDDELF